MKNELENLMEVVKKDNPISVIFTKRKNRNRKFNKNLFTLVEWFTVMHIAMDGKEFYHSYTSIELDTDISRSTVIEGVKKLKEKGYISIRVGKLKNTKIDNCYFKFYPQKVLGDLEMIYDKGCKGFPSIKAWYTALTESSGNLKPKEPASIEEEAVLIEDQIDWDRVDEELEKTREQQKENVQISVPDENEFVLPEPPEIDYCLSSVNDIGNILFDIQQKQEIERHKEEYYQYVLGYLLIKKNLNVEGIDFATEYLNKKELAIEIFQALAVNKDKEELQENGAWDKEGIKLFMINWWNSQKEIIKLTDKFGLYKVRSGTGSYKMSEKQSAFLQGLLSKRKVLKQHQQHLFEQIYAIKATYTDISNIIEELGQAA